MYVSGAAQPDVRERRVVELLSNLIFLHTTIEKDDHV